MHNIDIAISILLLFGAFHQLTTQWKALNTRKRTKQSVSIYSARSQRGMRQHFSQALLGLLHISYLSSKSCRITKSSPPTSGLKLMTEADWPGVHGW